MLNRQLPVLKPGDTVEIVAPAARCSDKQLTDLKELLTSWQLNCIVDQAIFGEDLLCANNDEARLSLFKKALLNPEIKAVICARGGYGSMRLIPELANLKLPATPKLFVGMSDITALNLFLQQQWQWPTLHGTLSQDKFSPESIAACKSILFGTIDHVEFIAKPLNAAALQQHEIKSTLTGGNLCLIQTSIGTLWQLQGKNKIIFLEEVSERGYRVDRMLEHLRQANIFKDAAAIVFGDFINGDESDGTSLVKPVLERFAKSCNIPVVQVEGVGHAYQNFPLPLGTSASLKLGTSVKLICQA